MHCSWHKSSWICANKEKKCFFQGRSAWEGKKRKKSFLLRTVKKMERMCCIPWCGTDISVNVSRVPLLLPPLQVTIQQPGVASWGWVFCWKPGWCWLWHWFVYRWQGQLFHSDCYHWELWGLLLPLPALSVLSFSSVHGGVSLHVRVEVRGD